MSKAFSGVCDPLSLSVSSHDKTKTAATKVTGPSWYLHGGPKVKGQGYMVKKYKKDNRMAGASYAHYWVPNF